MKKLLFFVLFPLVVFAQPDFKYDDVVYKTLYSQDLAKFLNDNPGALLVDVRSPGEFNDTSEYGNLNIGRLRNAINIPIDSIPKHLDLLEEKSAAPIILYCSHSQRSRKVSKTLIENGFKKIYNLNGGMSILNQCDEKDFPGKKNLIVSSLPYKNIPANEAVALIGRNKNVTLLDIRPATQFEGRDTIQGFNIGRLRNAINIPKAELENNLAKLDKDKPVLVYDLGGRESSAAAKLLTDKGFSDVYHLLGGLSAVFGKENPTTETRKKLLEATPPYTILNIAEAIPALRSNAEKVIIDARSPEEFRNQSKEAWQNLGHVKGAVHFVPDDFETAKNGALQKHKNAKIILYGKNAPDYCLKLKLAGFKDVNLIYGGLWDIVSATFNMKKFKNDKDLLVDHDGIY